MFIFWRFAEESVQGLYMCQMDGFIAYANPKFCQMIGVTDVDDIREIHIDRFYPDLFNRKRHNVILPTILDTGEWTGELGLLSKNGQIIPTFENYFLIRNEKQVPLFIANSITDITDRRRSESHLARRLEIEQLVARISSRLIDYDDLDIAVWDSLKEIGVFSVASHACFFRFDTGNKQLISELSWESEIVNHVNPGMEQIPICLFHGWFRALKKGHYVHIADVEFLPHSLAVEKEFLEKYNIRSILMIPVFLDNHLFGAIVLDRCDMVSSWDHNDIQMLDLIAHVLTSAYRHRLSEDELLAHRNNLADLVQERTHDLESATKQIQDELAERIVIEKALRESEEKYANLVEHAQDGVMIIQHGAVQFSNHAMEYISGYKNKELTGLALESLFASNVDTYLSDFDQSKNTRVQLFDSELITKDKRQKDVEITGNNILYLNQPAIMLMIRDVTLKKQADRKIKEAIDMKSRFISMVSHELRTPFTIIKDCIEMLHYEIPGKLNGRQKQLSERAINHIGRLTRFVDDVLDFQRLNSGKIKCHLTKNNLNHVLSEVCDSLQEIAQQKKLTINLSQDVSIPLFLFDKDLMTQVFVNIITNAIKYTEHGRIDIITKMHDETVCIQVKDTGIGIRRRDRHKIFDQFEMLEDLSARKQKGSGLGLAISKEIIERHRGKIWVESKYGSGALFCIQLPTLMDTIISDTNLTVPISDC